MTLAIALIVMIMITAIALIAIRQTTVGQRLTGNFYDRDIAFQGAEAALAAAATALQNGTLTTIRNCGGGGSTCAANPFLDTTLPSGTIQTVPNSAFAPAANAASSPPQYVVENMGGFYNPSTSTGYLQSANSAQYGAQGVTALTVYYRITARSGDPSAIGDRAVVYLQAMYGE